MKVLIACEYSGTVREAFSKLGHDAWSCDLLETEIPGNHYQRDVRDVLDEEWDLIIAFPPCTDLAVSGARWFQEKIADGRQQKSIDFFMLFANAKCKRIAIENPVSIMSTQWRKPDQIIQPWQFGHGETKATCLWLKNLPKLESTNIVEGREQRIWKMPPGPDRWKERSRTFQGVADAMAKQWSEYMENNKKEVCEICGSEAIEVYECKMCGAMICDKCQAPYDQFIQIDFNCCADCGKYNPYDN